MNSLTTAARPVKAKPRKKDRTVRVLALLPDRTAGVLQIAEGKVTDRYFFSEVPDDFGRGFLVEKWQPGTEQAAGFICRSYHVNVDGKASSCECLGHTRWSHCRHVESLTALIAAGKLS